MQKPSNDFKAAYTSSKSSKFKFSNLLIAFLSIPLPACIKISPLYLVFQVLNSYFLYPLAISVAHGCFIFITFRLLLL